MEIPRKKKTLNSFFENMGNKLTGHASAKASGLNSNSYDGYQCVAVLNHYPNPMRLDSCRFPKIYWKVYQSV